MRHYAWIVVWATLMTGTLASAQGPSPYGNPGASGYPWAPGFPPPPQGYGPPPRMIQGNAMVSRPGVTQANPNFSPLRAYEDMQPSLPPAEPMRTPLPPLPPYVGVGGGPNWAAPGPQRMLSGQDLPPFTPPMMPNHHHGHIPVDPSCPPDMCMAPPNPLLPVDEVERRPPLPLKPNPYRIDSPEDRGPDRLYRGWLMNLLWRVNHTSAPEQFYHTWVRGEFLFWRIKSAPIAAPLVTTNDDPFTIAALNDPGTRILFGQGGNSSPDFGVASGWRISAGRWFDWDNPFGVEASAFLLENRSSLFSVSSAGGNAPIVSIPYFATEPFNIFDPRGETSLNAFGAPNQIDVRLTSQMWGAEANLVFDACPQSLAPLRLLTILGFRYLELKETLDLNDTFFDPFSTGRIVVGDRFETRNQFFGGQIGVRGAVTCGRWNLEATAKIALGNNHQTLNIGGSTTVYDAAFGFPPGSTNNGTFAQPSNSGSFQRNVFAYIPEGQLKLAYEINQSIRPFVGYNFLYMNNTLRPGNQIDREVNPTQNAFFVPPGTPTGPLAPLAAFRSTDFWVQGINVGLELRY